MRNLRIHFTVTEAHAGVLLADLCDRVDNLKIEVVEGDYPAKKKPNGAPTKAATRVYTGNTGHRRKVAEGGGSLIPEIFKGRIEKGKQYSYQDVRKVMFEAGYSPNGYSNALMRLKNAGILENTEARGVYVGLVNH